MNEQAYRLSKQIATNDYAISCSHPLTDIREKKKIIQRYNPYSEERRLTRMVALEKLKQWEKDLIIGSCIK